MELDREDLRLWLAAHGPDEGVGIAGRANGCPISSWLQARYGGSWHSIPQLRYARHFDGRRSLEVRLPVWGAMFASAVDRHGLRPITAKEALTILDSIEVES